MTERTYDEQVDANLVAERATKVDAPAAAMKSLTEKYQAHQAAVVDRAAEVADGVRERMSGGLSSSDQAALLDPGLVEFDRVNYRVASDALAQVSDPDLIRRAVLSAEADGEAEWSMAWKGRQAEVQMAVARETDPAWRAAGEMNRAIADQAKQLIADQAAGRVGGIVGAQRDAAVSDIVAQALVGTGYATLDEFDTAVAGLKKRAPSDVSARSQLQSLTMANQRVVDARRQLGSLEGVSEGSIEDKLAAFGQI